MNILIEKLSKGDIKQIIFNFPKGNNRRKNMDDFGKYIKSTYPNLYDIYGLIFVSIELTEKSTKDNDFLNYVGKIADSGIISGNADKFEYIYDMYKGNKLELYDENVVHINKEDVPNIMLLKSLFSRDYDDFVYIVNAFSIFSDKDKLKKYLPNTYGEISIKNIFFDKSNKLLSKDKIYDNIDNVYYDDMVSDKNKKNHKNDDDAKDDSEDDAELVDFRYMTNLTKKYKDDSIESMADYMMFLWEQYKSRIKDDKQSMLLDGIFTKGDKVKIFDGLIDNPKIFHVNDSEENVAKKLFSYAYEKVNG